jgi:hypothetical protein
LEGKNGFEHLWEEILNCLFGKQRLHR